MRTMVLPLMMLLASAPAFAQTSAAESGPDARAEQRQQLLDNRVDMLAGKLGLDAAATATLRQTLVRYGAQAAPLRKDSWQTRRALEEELAKPQPDAARVTQLTDQLSSDRQKMMSIEAQRQAELKQQLTPVQYAQLVMSRHAMGRGGHHGMRGHHPGKGGPAPSEQ
jgi:Spy/CpxP family protein refolding chaperone